MYLKDIVSGPTETFYTEINREDPRPATSFFGLANSQLLEGINIYKLHIHYKHSFGNKKGIKVKPVHLKLRSEQLGDPSTYSPQFITHLCRFISEFHPQRKRQFALFEPQQTNMVDACWQYTQAEVCALDLQHRPEMLNVLSIRLDLIDNMEKLTGYLRQQQTFLRTKKTKYERLTPREREILKLLARGFNNPAIANKIFISRRTVEQHRKNLVRKIGTNSLAEIIKYDQTFELHIGLDKTHKTTNHDI